MQGVTIGIIEALLIFATIAIPSLDPIHRAFSSFSMTDIYYEIIHDDTADIDPEIVIVDITDLHNRAKIANVINQINDLSPKILAVDIIFENFGNDTMDDVALVDAVCNADNILLATKLTEYDPICDSFSNMLMPFFADNSIGKYAYSNVPQDVPGGLVRDYTIAQQYNDSTVYSLPYMTACIASGAKMQTVEDNQRSIIFTNTAFRKINYDDIAANAEHITDKIVLMGTYSAEEDCHITPIGKIPGIEINAFAIQTILSNRKIENAGLLISLLLCFIACYISAWIGSYLQSNDQSIVKRLLISVTYSPILIILIVWLSLWLFVNYDYDIHPMYALFGLLLVSDAYEVQELCINLWHKIINIRKKSKSKNNETADK